MQPMRTSLVFEQEGKDDRLAVHSEAVRFRNDPLPHSDALESSTLSTSQ